MEEKKPRNCSHAKYLGFIDDCEITVCTKKSIPMQDGETFLSICWYDGSDGSINVDRRIGIFHANLDIAYGPCYDCENFIPVNDLVEISKREKWGKDV